MFHACVSCSIFMSNFYILGSKFYVVCPMSPAIFYVPHLKFLGLVLVSYIPHTMSHVLGPCSVFDDSGSSQGLGHTP